MAAELEKKPEEQKRRRLTDAEAKELEAKGVRVVDHDAERAGPIVQRPTAERISQGGVVENKEDRLGKAKPWYTFEAAHDGLLAAGLISKKAWEGGNLFRSEWEKAAGSGVAAANMEGSVDGSGRDVSERQAQAKLRIARWSRELAAPSFSCLQSVIGQGVYASTWAKNRGEHPACGRIMLITSLEQFALQC